jgi:hypothetical protein
MGKENTSAFYGVFSAWRPKVNEGGHRDGPRSLVNASNFGLGIPYSNQLWNILYFRKEPRKAKA